MQEIWKDIPGYEKMYQASNLGNIRSLDRCVNGNKNKFRLYPGTILIQQNRGKYVGVSLCKNKKCKSLLVHRLIAQTFITNVENKSQVNHKDGNKQNNNVNNLEWVTPSENDKHAFKIGLKNQKGENNNLSKLTNEAVRVIKNSITLTNIELANIFNISKPAISMIRTGKRWNFI